MSPPDARSGSGSGAAFGSGEQLVRIAGRRLRVTNLDKVLYPETGTTKGEVLDYYTRIAPLLIPHATRPARDPQALGRRGRHRASIPSRPSSRSTSKPARPRGSRGVRSSTRAGRRTTRSSSTCRRSCTSRRSRASSCTCRSGASRPTAAAATPTASCSTSTPVPASVSPSAPRSPAGRARSSSGMGLEPYPVTSGSKGIHLYAALPGEQTSDQITALAKELARAIEADHPDLVVSNMAKVERPGTRLHRLEPEQREQDHDRAVLAARPPASDGRGAAHVGGAR